MPSNDQVARVLELLRKPGADANYVRFFSRLSHPEWILPLQEAGYFVTPPEPVPVGEGISYPGWPESDYLLRVVDQAPATVAGVLASIKINDNPRVHADLALIAARLPSKAALAFATREMRWLAERFHLPLNLPSALAQLTIHLADLGKTRRAQELAELVLGVRVTPGTEDSWNTRVEPRMDGWAYRQLSRKLLLDLHPKLGLTVVELAADLLDQALRLTSHEAPFDYSAIWRREIGADPEVYLNDPRQALITALADAAIAEADDQGEKLEAVLKTVDGHDWAVFRRVTLHVVTAKPDVAPKIGEEYLLSREAINDVDTAREYASLLSAVFPTLPGRQKRKWFALVHRGPTWPSPDREQREKDEISEEYYESYVESWKRNWIAQVRDYLRPEQADALRALEDRYGPASTPAASGEVQSWTGPTSPLSDDELRDRSPQDLVRFMQTWQPAREPMSPSPEGLARRVTDRVAAEPAAFVELTTEIARLEPTYVRAVVQGFEKAVKEDGPSFPWDGVLNLLEAVLQRRPIGRDQESRGLDHDPGWIWARGAVADVITAALRSERLPRELGDRAWQLLDELSWDSDPTPEHEQRYGGNNMDPLTLSLNTTRGKAMHGVLAFALWRKNDSGQEDDFSLDAIPEVRRNLDDHLDPSREPSTTVRGVFGASLYQLFWLDRDWLTQTLPKLFPSTTDQELGRAAWESYLSYGSQPYHLFPLLEKEYRRAIAELPSTVEPGRSRMGRAPGLVLAEHLGIFYYNGRIDLDATGLLDQFFTHADTKLQAHLVDFLGRALQRAEDEAVPSEVIDRMLTLWDWIVGRVAPSERAVALADFGWWYGASILDVRWRDQQLATLLRMKVPVEPEFVTIKAFSQSATEDLGATLEIIYLYVQVEGNHWRLLNANDELRAILNLGVNGDDATREKTRELINLLAAKGLGDFLDLLGSPPS
jgi:hypothetical protein